MAQNGAGSMRLFDIHAHLADERLLSRVDTVIAESRARGVSGILVNSARYADWTAVLAFANHPGIYAALGIHPFFVDDWSGERGRELRALATQRGRLQAVGEVGLDAYDSRDVLPQQLEVLAAQLRIAKAAGLPVILHNRKAWSEFFGLLRDIGCDTLAGVCHSFNGSREILAKVLDRGLHVSFAGPVTYGNARRLRAAAAYTPLDRLLTESDAPDLPPASRRGMLSYPWCVAEVVSTIAEIKHLPPHRVADAVAANFLGLIRG